MPKQLLIVRHAKSDKDDPRLADFDRPLNKRGEKNAPEMAQRLLNRHLIPQLLVSSPAKRAITTANYFADVLGFDKKQIQEEKAIYEASASELLEVINNLDKKYNSIALFGHNPGLTDLVWNLCSCDIYNIPTCGIVSIEFLFDDWGLITNRTGKLQFFDYPRNTESI